MCGLKVGSGSNQNPGVFKSITQLQWSSITEISISKQCSDILAQLIKDKLVFFIAITEMIEMTVQILYFRLYLYGCCFDFVLFFYFYFTPVISSIAHWSFKNTVL